MTRRVVSMTVLLLVANLHIITFGLKVTVKGNCYSKILYVVSDSTSCSSLPRTNTDSECHPLSFYIQNVSQYFTSNTVMIFMPGHHQLNLSLDGVPVVNVTGISNLAMTGQGAVMYNESEEGAPLPNSTILCNSNNENNPRNGILFYKSDAIHIENLTIENCGAKFTVRGPDDFTLVSALTFRESYNISLTQVRIDKSLGFGLDADRIFGSFQVSKSAFMWCRAYPLHYNKNVGGNARFWYSSYKHNQTAQNTTLNIDRSWFMYGHLSNKDRYRGFYYASGLIILIYIPSVDVQINNTTMKHNVGTHGGNVAIQVTDYHENTSKIAINNSVIADGSAIRGGGLQFWVQVDHKPNPQRITANSKTRFIIKITNTNFTNNTAGESGGGIYIGHYESNITDSVVRHILFRGCTFSYNSVHYTPSLTRSYSGAAVQVLRHNIDDFVSRSVPQYSIDFDRCIVVNNSLKDVTNEGGILDFVSTQNVIVKDSTFNFNKGTAISLRQSNIKFLGNTTFMKNWGTHGGALKFCELSKMYLPSGGVYIDFIENSANISGGAIYVSQQLCLETAPPCFFQVIRHKYSSIYNLKTRLRFHNNTAVLAGDTVYGGQVDHCYLYYSGYDNHSTYLSHRVFSEIFDLSDQAESLSLVSSPPYGACFYNTSIDNEPILCDDMVYPSLVYAGQSFTVDVVAVGQQNGTSPVSSSFFQLKSLDSSPEYTKVVINTQVSNEELHMHTMPYASLNCTIYSNQSSITFSLILQQASQAELRYVHYKPNNLKVNLGECPWGFKLTKAPPYTCVCDSLLDNFSIPCNINTQNVTRWGFYWLGCDSYQDQLDMNHTESMVLSTNVKCKGVRLAIRCVLDYCNTSRTNISAFTLDNQCTEGREGVLCGRCKQNYSLSVGTSRCLPSCTAYMVYVLVGVWIASGMLLVLFLILCNFTISEGTINGLFFYAHMIHKNANLFFPGSTGTSNTNVFRLFIAWLNLDLGFEVCFYKTMTQYQKVWLQFGFLFYIWTLEYFIIVLSRKYIFFTRVVGRNVVKVLATLGLVSFPLMFNTALSSLEFAFVYHTDRQKTTVWQSDGNVDYLKGKHIPLFILGTAFCILALLYTLALLFIQCLQKQPNVLCFRWIERQRPFFEAHTGPCHVHYRFWPGCLFFTRITLFTLCSLLIDKNNLNLYIIITACVVTQIIAFVLPNRVYKRWPLNVLEFLFILNLGVVSGLLATFCRANFITPQPKFNYQSYYFVYPSVTLTMVLFAGILTYHCMKQLKSYLWCQKLNAFVINNRTAKLLRFKTFNVKKESHDEEESEPFLQQNEDMPQVVRVNDYRETLIAD